MENNLIFKNLSNYLNELEGNLNLLNNSNIERENLQKIKNIKERIKDPKIKIGFWSFFSAGKSTIINNLVDREILPVGQKTTTSIATTLCYGNEDKIEVILKDKEEFKNMLSDKIREINYSENRKGTMFSYDYSKKLVDSGYFSPTNRCETFIKNFKIEEKNNFSNNICESKLNLDLVPREYTSKAEEKIQKQLKEIHLLIDIFTNNMKIDDLKHLNENDFKYSNKIKEIIINIKDWKFDKNIQILDLPGFGSSNKEHMESAMEKLKDMNAFVFVESETVTEGECKEEILKLKTQFPDIFKNSYFVKNKMSFLKSDDKDNFNQKMKSFDDFAKILGFDKNKIFKIDALKESNGVKCEYYDGFINFKNKLIEDSNQTIFREFITNSIKTLENTQINIVNKIGVEINNLGIDDSKNDNHLKGVFLKSKINEECRKFKKELKLSFDKINKVDNRNLIQEDVKNKLNVKEEIAGIISKNKSDIKNTSKSKKDIHFLDFSILFEEILSKIEINELIRKKCKLIIKDNFSEDFYSKLSNVFNDSLLKFVPKKEKDCLKNVMANSIEERINGAIDIILFDYSKDIDNIRIKTRLAYDSLTRTPLILSIEKLRENKHLFRKLDITDKNIPREILIKIKDWYDIKEYNKNEEIDQFEILSKIIVFEINEYIADDIIPNINKYIVAIMNNYIKDVVINAKEILNFDNFEAEFQQNVEDSINEKIDSVIRNKKQEKNRLLQCKKNIETAKETLLNSIK